MKMHIGLTLIATAFLLSKIALGSGLTLPALRIGVIQPASPPLFPYQKQIEKGIEVAVETADSLYPQLKEKLELHYLQATGDRKIDRQAIQRLVDKQNINDPNYEKMSDNFDNSIAFKAACDLVLKGLDQPSGYTEPLLHKRRLEKKLSH